MTATLVTTHYGQVQGAQIDEVSVWKGLPYAKAMLGILRFRASQPEGVPNWASYDLENRTTMVFNEECKVISDPNKEQRLLWKSASAVKQ